MARRFKFYIYPLLLFLLSILILLHPKLALADGPVLDVWYGSHQDFGQIGIPQEWVNILGNVSDPDGSVTSLTYSLNNEPELSLSMGPANDRLVSEGDFNVEIAYTDLISGLNQVVITATDNLTNTTVETVTLEYVSGNTWPTSYSIDWNSTSSIQDVVQVVDGLWTLETDSIRTVEIGYDRLVAIGDVTWDDYEATVPITVHGIDSTQINRPAVGIIERWDGHNDLGGSQPRLGWSPLGAIGMYRWYNDTLGPRFQIYENDGSVRISDTSGKELTFDVPYNFKMRVETKVGQTAGFYSFKVWEDGQPEPTDWLLTHQATSGLQNGSLLLFAHHTDASFGDVAIVPLSEIISTLQVTTVGSGTVTVDPVQSEYNYGQVVTLTAVAALDWTFSGWSGNLSGNEITKTLTMNDNQVITATFSEAISHALTITEVGSGTVTVEPNQTEYSYGTVITLTAIADPGWRFADWSGDLSGSEITKTLTITGDRVVTATFSELTSHTLTVTAVGSGTVTVEPNQSEYLYGTIVTATAVATPNWTFSGWSGALSGSEPTKTLVITGDQVITAIFTPGSSESTIVSDDFNTCSLNTDLWTFINPLGDASSVTTNGSQVKIFVPDSANHEVWTTNHAPRIMQATNDTDFELEARFDSAVSQQYQEQGIIVQGENSNYLRLEFYGDGTNTHIFAVSIINGSPTSWKDTTIANGVPMYMRVKREGDLWTQSYSNTMSLSWTPHVSFTHAFSVTSVGLYGGNYNISPTDIPTHTAVTDYFYNTASPGAGDVNGNTLTIYTNGNGSVTKDSDPPYICGQIVELTANPAPGWNFDSWSGDLIGNTSPATLTITGSHTVTATFSAEAYTLTIAKDGSGNGSVSKEPNQPSYTYGNVVTLTAQANPGSTFMGWSDGLGASETVTVTMTSDKVVTATFSAITYTLTSATDGNGQGSVTRAPAPPYYYGHVVTLTAQAEPGSIFTGWSGGLGTTNPLTVTMTSDWIVTATFDLINPEEDSFKVFLPIIVK